MFMPDGFTGQCKVITSMVSSDKNVNCQIMANKREMRVKEYTWQGFLPAARDGSAMINWGDKEDNIDDGSVITLTKPQDRSQTLWHFTLTKKRHSGPCTGQQ